MKINLIPVLFWCAAGLAGFAIFGTAQAMAGALAIVMGISILLSLFL